MIRSLALFLVTAALGAVVWAFQDGAEGQMPMPQPGAEHKVLQRSVGTWDSSMDVMGQVSKGTMTVELGPGGFTTFSRFKGDMMGMPFEGRGVDGYDENKKKYVSLWTDNMVPYPILLEGDWDEKSQTLTMFGNMPDMTGALVKHRLVTKWPNADTMDFEVFAPTPEGKDASSFKIHYTRKK